MNDKNKEKVTEEFLLLEYQELLHEYNRLREEGVGRLNFYIAITSSIFAGLALLSQISLVPVAFQLATIFAAVFLLLIGWPIYRYTINRD